MFVLRILLLGIILVAVPVVVGSLFAGVDKRCRSLPFWWISGQMLLWAGFQVITVPIVLKQGRFEWVVWLFGLYMAVLVLLSAGVLVRRKRGRARLHAVKNFSGEERRTYRLLWAIFAVIFVFQMLQCVRLAYADGDDAFYVATAAIAEESETMYTKLAYTGGTTELDARYGLAPFPIWIAFLARISGIRTVAVAQFFVPPILISMAYCVYYLLGSRLFRKHKEKLPLFMIFTEILVLFGDYSMYTPEKFLIARSRQGKAALCAIVIPFLVFLLLILMEHLEEKQRISLFCWFLLLCGLTAACLCSTLGAVLGSMLVGVTGICAAVCYRRVGILVPMALCCVTCVAEAILYLM